MEPDGLKPLFAPKSAALIGATQKMGFGYGQTRTLLQSKKSGAEIFLVSRSQPEVFGHKTYASVSEIPHDVELAVLIVPAPAVLPVLRECAAKGVKAAVVQSAGFAEIGAEGAALQKELTALARQTGLRVLGPNCVGLINTENGFSTSETIPEAMQPGPIGVIAQSGVFGNILMDRGPEEGVYFSKVVTLGNRCDVDESEVIRYLGHDAQTRVITLYLESVQDGPRFIKAVRETSLKKPVVIIKSGRTPAGKAATVSHTGSLSGEDDIYNAAFAQSGALRARGIEDLFDLAKALAHQPLPRGDRVVVVTSSGSLGAMAADDMSDLGLPLADLSADTVSMVKDGAPPWMNVKNPLDLGPSGLFAQGVRAVLQDPNVDAILAIFILPWIVMQELAADGAGAHAFFPDLSAYNLDGASKPFLVASPGKSEMRAALHQAYGEKFPIFRSPEGAARALAGMVRYRKWLDSQGGE